MDFDEYDYLEQTVENPEVLKEKETTNGGDENTKSNGKDRRSSRHRGADNDDELDGRSGKDHRRSSRHRSDENDDDLDSRSKRARSERARSGDDTRGHDRHRERGSSRHRSRDGERSERDRHRSSREHRDKDRDRYREEINGKERDSDRDKERKRDKDKEREGDKDRERERVKDHDKVRERDRESEREKDKEREKEKDKEIEKVKEKEKERERSRRSRSSSEKRRSDRDREAERERDREKSREKERERELREREREGSPPGICFVDLNARRNIAPNSKFFCAYCFECHVNAKNGCFSVCSTLRYKDKKEEVAEAEADPERDQRTVFAYQICLKADERDVYEFFSRAGKVRDVKLIMDRNSRRSKGVGYIEFYDAMSVPMAIALSGQLLLSQPVMVKPSEAEKNLVQSNVAIVGPGGSIGPYSGGARRLYVGNLHFNITEDQLRQVFEPFGPVELVQLPLDQESGQCKGFGFVQFARLEDARAAQSLNGQLDIAGRIIKVSAVSDQVGMQDIGANAGDFDDDDGGGLGLNARSRAILMQKLDRSGTATSITGSLGSPVVNGTGLALPATSVLGVASVVNPLVASLGQTSIPALAGIPGANLPGPPIVPPVDLIGVPSECLLLKNMFDPNIETEPDFDLDIKDDVQDECLKFGVLKHIYVDKNSAGHVYLRFDNTQSARNAQQALHGRWFAGKMITATYMLPLNYEAKFPDGA